MIKVRNGELGLEQSIMSIALGKLFNAPFKKLETIKNVVKLQKVIAVSVKEFIDIRNKIVEAHGTEENGQKMIQLNNPEFLELLEQEIELDVDKIKITMEEFNEAEVPLSANEYVGLEPFIDFE